jgi:heme-degrading monooxygenase HmoA
MESIRRQNPQAALMSLEAAAASARGGLASLFSTAEEYEPVVRSSWSARWCCSPDQPALSSRPGRRSGAFLFFAVCGRHAHLTTRVEPMITEIAQIDVKPGSEKDFEAAVARAKAAFGRSKGFHGFELHKSIEKPQRYRLMVQWATLENHTVDFRGSENFTEWRGLVGQYFASPPEVEHTETVLTT